MRPVLLSAWGNYRRWHPAGAVPYKKGAAFHSLQFTVSIKNAKSKQIIWTSCCFGCSVTKLCLTLCDHVDCSAPGSPVLLYLPELVQTHVHGVGDAIQPSHPLLPPFPPVLNLSQHQGLYNSVSSSHRVTKIGASALASGFQWIFRIDLLQYWLVGSPCSPKDFKEFSSTTIQKHQFYGAQPSLWPNSHIHTWLLEKP